MNCNSEKNYKPSLDLHNAFIPEERYQFLISFSVVKGT